MTTTTLLETGTEILKTDRLGRVRTSAVRREAILDEFERSGGSGAQFAALLGIKYPTFANWVVRRRKRRTPVLGSSQELGDVKKTTISPVRWMEAVLEKPSAPEALRVQLPGGAQVELSAQGQMPLLVDLLRELALKRVS